MTSLERALFRVRSVQHVQTKFIAINTHLHGGLRLAVSLKSQRNRRKLKERMPVDCVSMLTVWREFMK
jgi:hypothetical protein